MIEERIQYGIDNFLEDNFFLPFSKLHVDVQGDNLCSEDYDHKGKCNFLKKESPFKLRRIVDHVLLQKKEEKWILHLIEMKSKVDNKKWHEIKQKIRASYFNVRALEGVLGIHIDEIRTYTTYESTGFWNTDRSEDPKIMVAPLGKPMPPAPEKEWENNIISVDVGAVMKFQHVAVKMQRTEEGDKLIGNLRIC